MELQVYEPLLFISETLILKPRETADSLILFSLHFFTFPSAFAVRLLALVVAFVLAADRRAMPHLAANGTLMQATLWAWIRASVLIELPANFHVSVRGLC